MLYLLKHHFDPDLDPLKLKPELQDDGSVDHHKLNLVQNVEAGCVIAEWEELPDVEGADSRFIYPEMIFPAGRGTGLKRKHPNKLYAAINGWVSYLNGKIVVQENLTLTGDVDFHTGNIDFVGNLSVGGSIRSGFAVRGRDITVLGQTEAANVEALRDLNCRGGVKGSKDAFLAAGKNLKVSFCEFGTLKAGEDVLVKGSLMHSDVYAGKRLAVGGRLTGGHHYCHEYIFVGEQLGGGLGTDTSLVLGYNPTLLYADEEYNRRIIKLRKTIQTCKKILDKNDEDSALVKTKLDAALKEMALVKLLKRKLWEGIQGTESIDHCKVLVAGVVKPGVEISIGPAYLKVDEFLEDVYFYYENGEVRIGTTTRKIKR